MDINKPKVGIGACLTGNPVRYNGESKRKNIHIESLKKHLLISEHCPEMAIGLGTPREPVRLVGDIANTRLVDSKTQSKDYTDAMKNYAESVYTGNCEMAGYILVKGSPSCGYERVKRYNQRGNPVKNDSMGIFAAALHTLDPLLPLEEDGRLNDPALRENFICRVYAYHDWKQFIKTGISHHSLIQFWARYKYLVMAHHPANYSRIGRMLANSSHRSIDILAQQFIALLMSSLQKQATRKTHSNALGHIRGYLKKLLGKSEKAELGLLLDQYRLGIVPIIVPLTLIRHYFNRHPNHYIDKQVYLRPYPEQMSLRNHIS
jgi:uncharacterized protein YbgA (DUF1722 family)/uncharacterized protein YbbK (DUF523 family)